MAARAQLSWVDDTTAGFIHVDVIPSLEDTLSSTVTEFPVEDGSIISEHIIHHPELLTLQIAQTQLPFTDSNEDGDELDFVKTSYPLDLPKTRFKPKGALFLMLAAEAGVAAAVGAIGGALGLGGGGAPSVAIEVFRPPYEGKDRINDLFDKLRAARLRGSEMTLDWLGRSWDGFYIQQITYSRKKGRELGEFGVVLKHVETVSTGTAKLPTPAEARLKAGVHGGNKPGKQLTEAEKEAARKAALRSVADHIFS
jgi:hypothetical protein